MCGCPSHYIRLVDTISRVGPPAFLLYSQKNKISRLLMVSPVPGELEDVPDIVLPIKKARSLQSVSFDQVEDMIYWVDQGTGEVYLIRPGNRSYQRGGHHCLICGCKGRLEGV